jgi:glycosyltransferase involved in cell wall biosynthesis
MKVLVTGPSQYGGQGGQVAHINNIEKSFINDKYDIKFFTSSSALEGRESSIKKLYFLVVRFIYFPFCLFNKQVLHINTSLDDKAIIRDLGLMLWAVILCKPFILQIHGGLLATTNIFKIVFLLRIWCWFLRRSQSVWVLTDRQADELGLIGVKNVTKMVNFIEMPEAPSSFPAPFTFLFMGRIVRNKGVFEIIDAVQTLKGSGQEYQVVICGEGSDLQELKQQIERSGVSEVVSCVGVVTGLEKHRAFQGASALLLPSYAEGLPYSVLEAMSYGVPAICTEVGALPDIISNEVEGLLIKPRSSKMLCSAMNIMLNDPILTKQMGERSRDKMQKRFSLKVLNKRFKKAWIHAAY